GDVGTFFHVLLEEDLVPASPHFLRGHRAGSANQLAILFNRGPHHLRPRRRRGRWRGCWLRRALLRALLSPFLRPSFRLRGVWLGAPSQPSTDERGPQGLQGCAAPEPARWVARGKFSLEVARLGSSG